MESILASNVTYAQFRKIWHGSLKSRQSVDADRFLHQLQQTETISQMSPSVLYLADMQQMQYLYMSKNVQTMSGYAAEEFLTKGAYFSYSLIHPDDRCQILEQVHQKQLAFLRGVPPQAHAHYKFTYNYRFRRSDGSYIPTLKQDVILQSDEQGNPLLMMGMASDISALKPDTGIRLSVIHYLNGTQQAQQLYQSPSDWISRRERDVLALIVAGRSSAQIAEQLGISIHTVKNHRRHLLEKSGHKKMAEVIQLAVSKGVV